MTILVTGATGTVGRHVVAQLVQRGAAVRALVRDPAKADFPAGVEVVQGDLLDVDVNLDADLNLAAPIDGAVAANANVAAPIDAAVSANVGSIGSEATAVAQQDAIITQNIDADATATADQQSDITQ